MRTRRTCCQSFYTLLLVMLLALLSLGSCIRYITYECPTPVDPSPIILTNDFLFITTNIVEVVNETVVTNNINIIHEIVITNIVDLVVTNQITVTNEVVVPVPIPPIDPVPPIVEPIPSVPPIVEPLPPIVEPPVVPVEPIPIDPMSLMPQLFTSTIGIGGVFHSKSDFDYDGIELVDHGIVTIHNRDQKKVDEIKEIVWRDDSDSYFCTRQGYIWKGSKKHIYWCIMYWFN